MWLLLVEPWAMPWWIELLLLGAAAALWALGRFNSDDVIGLLEKLIAVALLLVVLFGGRPIVLELAALAIACGLPSAARLDAQQRSRTLRGRDSRMSPSGPSAG